MLKHVTPYYDAFNRFHSLLMAVLLLWLTVSMPFVNSVQQELAIEQISSDGDTDPLPGANEEKVETGVNGLSEYLHEYHLGLLPVVALLAAFKSHPDAVWPAYHPEQLSPPPEWCSFSA